MQTTPKTRRVAVLGAATALASAAFAVPALAQARDQAPADARPDRAGTAEPGEHHAEMLAELDGLDGDAVAERLEELATERAAVRAERQADRAASRAERQAGREQLRADRHAELLTELEGLEADEVAEKLEELHTERAAFRAERQADRAAFRAERQADRAASRAEREGAGFGRGSGPRMGPAEDCPLASD